MIDIKKLLHKEKIKSSYITALSNIKDLEESVKICSPNTPSKTFLSTIFHLLQWQTIFHLLQRQTIKTIKDIVESAAWNR